VLAILGSAAVKQISTASGDCEKQYIMNIQIIFKSNSLFGKKCSVFGEIDYS